MSTASGPAANPGAGSGPAAGGRARDDRERNGDCQGNQGCCDGSAQLAGGVYVPWAGLLRPLLRLLARGEPVTIEELAAASGRSAAEVRDGLAAQPDTEYDDVGRIVGAGITLRPTPHRFTVAGRQLYTWCALDTLALPAILGTPAEVASVCQATGQTVRLQALEGVSDADPPSAVVSLVTPHEWSSVREAFCDHSHFFVSPAAARPWLDEHPGATILPVAEAFQASRPIIDALLRTDDPPDPCC